MATPHAGPASTAPGVPSGPATSDSGQDAFREGAAPPATPFTPVQAGERIVTLDVLRGIALFGVVAANIWLWFSGITFRFPDYNTEVWSGSPEGIAFLFIAFFIATKAMTTFSFLFGLGFAVQMMRAEARGRSIVGHHSRRLAVLLLIGALHAVFLWYGDILTLYALLGFGLLLFRRRSDRTLLVWSAVFVVVLPIVLGAVPFVMALLNPGSAPDPATILGELADRNRTLLTNFASAEPGQIVRGNLEMLRQWWLSPKVMMMNLGVFGVFLLGLYAGRRRIFEDPGAHAPLLRRLIVVGFPLGMIGTGAGLWLRSMPVEQMIARPWMPLALATTIAAGTLPFALAYIATATLLMERPVWRRRLSGFAPVGRMALTNYLAQTVLCITIFYGGGLVGRVGALFGLIVALVIFAAQMVWSAWWLARFRFGPMEWLWRSAVYGRLQPMRISPAVAPAPGARERK